MNKRQIQKQETKAKILTAAKQIFMKRGMLNTATSQIAEAAGIAHGTLFLHFPTKDSLIIQLLDIEMVKFSDNIKKLLVDSSKVEILLIQYLHLIESEELFFSTLARELPFYQSELRRKIIFRESIIREQFYNAIQDGIAEGAFSEIEIPSTLTFLFGTINYYLSLRNMFVKDESVIAKFKDSIVNNFMRMLK